MPRGQPDYGLLTQTPVASGISDPGEAAARLGSINVYDRRGWTVYMDDFEAPVLKWRVASNIGGTDPVLSTANAWMGVQSVYFIAAAGAGEYASITRNFPLMRLGRVALEFFIDIYTLTPGYFRVRFLLEDGTNLTRGELRLDSEARTATIITAAGAIVVMTDCLTESLYRPFVPIKLVLDMDTDKYVRLLIGPTETDISEHELVVVGATTNNLITTGLYLSGDAVGVMACYVDNFILTQNEP